MSARDVDRLLAQDSFDLSDVGRVHDREDLGESWVHARSVERGTAKLARPLDYLLFGPPRRGGLVLIPVGAGDPIRGGDDVDAGLEDRLVEVNVGEDAVEGHTVRPCGDDLVD